MGSFILHQITRVKQTSLKLEAIRKQIKRDMRVCVFLDRFDGSAFGLEKFLIELHTPLHVVE
jgi:hypothetical protein